MDDQVAIFLKALSRLMGWIYATCWSASFYPQPILNWQRRSTHGLAIDFPTTNLLGFFCYFIYTSAFLYSPVIREQYAARHPLSPDPSVRFNDLAFAAHAVVICIIVYSQFYPSVWGFKVSKHQRASKAVVGMCWGCVGAVVLVLLLVTSTRDGGYDPLDWAWIDVIYTVSYIKLLVTVVKYIPQAWVNYKRQSTVGWSILPILLDLAGGVLSVLQLVIDSALQADWSGITGNPVKLGLGNVSIFFDVVFIVQHYILYRESNGSGGSDRIEEDGASAPLLGSRSV